MTLQSRTLAPSKVRSLQLGLLLIYLSVFLVLPVGTMMVQGLARGNQAELPLTLVALNPLVVKSLMNSLATACASAVLAASLALPLAMVLWRFGVHTPLFVNLCGFLPLFVPPFVLVVSLQTLLGRGTALGMLLQSLGDMDPVFWGLPGVAVVEALHYFPLILVTLIMTTSAHQQQAHEAAALGVGWSQLVRRIFFPLSMPGLAFGMLLIFLKTMDDLATPLTLGVHNLLAPQLFLRVSTYGATDPISSLMATMLIVVSVLAWFASLGLLQRQLAFRDASIDLPMHHRYNRPLWIGFVVVGGLFLLYAVCYAGVLLNSFARIWSYSVLPTSFAITHYLSVFDAERGSFFNTLVYCGFAAVLDVCIGYMMARAIARTTPTRKKWLTWGAAGLLSVPGVALAIAYLQFFHGFALPLFKQPLDVTWFLLPMAFSVKGLPFAIQACRIALSSVPANYIDAANISGVGRFGITAKIVLPMMAFGLLMAFMISFGVAAADLSTAMLLVPSEANAPVSYSIYLNMQSTTGSGVGAALAMLLLGLVVLVMGSLVFWMRKRWKTASNFRKYVLARH
jgi:iron(III) transport system permease protein